MTNSEKMVWAGSFSRFYADELLRLLDTPGNRAAIQLGSEATVRAARKKAAITAVRLAWSSVLTLRNLGPELAEVEMPVGALSMRDEILGEDR